MYIYIISLLVAICTIDGENFAVKLILRLRPTVNFNTRKLNLRGDDQWISLHAQVHTPRDKCLIDDYSQRSLALLIPGSRLNARNSPGVHP